MNLCGYKDGAVRIAVVFPLKAGGWAVAGQHTWPGGQTLRAFATLDAAKANVAERNPFMRIVWKEEPV